MSISVLTDRAGVDGAPNTAPDVGVAGTVEAVEEALRADGHVVTRVGAARDGRWMDTLRATPPDLVFNLCEGVDGDAHFESPAIAVLELLGVPHTGSSAWTTALCQHKPAANALLAHVGLPVPPWSTVRASTPLSGVGFPAIVKPATEDASLGIEQRAVVSDVGALAAHVREVGQRWPELLVQRFIDGREVNVGVLGGEALPPSEIDFSRMPAGLWRIVSYRSKWSVGSEEDQGAQPVCPANLPAALTAELQALALAAWGAVGGGGYGRVDFRIDEAGRPWVLEVNPNPDLSPDAGLARMARAAGLDYAALVRRVCALAAPGAAPGASTRRGASVVSGINPRDHGPRLNIAAAAGAS